MSERLILTDLCAKFGMSHGRARTLLAQAGLDRDSRNRYDAAEAREVLSASIDPQVALGNRTAGRGSGAASIEVSALAAARLETERARNVSLGINNDLKLGKLVSKDTVVEAGEAFAGHIRNGFLGLAPRIASRLAGRTTAEITATLDAEVRRVLTDLADIDAYVLGT